jgi:hypothetical protein
VGNECCGNCRFFDRDDRNNRAAADDVNAVQPNVYDLDWCGEWRPDPNAEPERG